MKILVDVQIYISVPLISTMSNIYEGTFCENS